MKRIGFLFLLVAVLSGAAVAQSGADISGLGADFENLIDQLGQEMLPNLQQQAIWGQFPGQAALPDDSKFFFTLSAGAVLGFNGLLGFVEETNSAFEVINVYQLFETILSGGEGGEALASAQNTIATVQNIFPYPVARAGVGFRLPWDLEAMVDFAILPQFLTTGGINIANNLTDGTIPPVELNALHVGSRVRKVLLRDAPGIPAVSIGAGYSYSGFNVGYDFAEIGDIDTAIGVISFAGQFFLENRINSFGLDLQVSKNLGFFVPFIGISPYYQLARFSGGIGTTDNPFDAAVDFENGGSDRDIVYDAEAPNTTFADDDVSLLLFGGFDLVFGRFALEVHGSYTIGDGWPAVSLGTRIQ